MGKMRTNKSMGKGAGTRRQQSMAEDFVKPRSSKARSSSSMLGELVIDPKVKCILRRNGAHITMLGTLRRLTVAELSRLRLLGGCASVTQKGDRADIVFAHPKYSDAAFEQLTLNRVEGVDMETIFNMDDTEFDDPANMRVGG